MNVGQDRVLVGYCLFMPSATFPEGNYYAVLWGIQATHGGMTNAMLQRSRALVEFAGIDVTVVTYEHDENLAQTRESLIERGRLIPGINILNMWEDLRTWDDEKLKLALTEGANAGDQWFAPRPESEREGSSLMLEVPDGDKDFSQRDYFRADGTLLVSHRKKVKGDSGVAVTICDNQGKPLGWFPGIRMFYRFWLSTLPKSPVGIFMLDSKTAANHYPEFRRDDAVTMYVVHGSHLADGVSSPHGELSPGRRHTFERLGDFDGVVLLTEAQRRDVEIGLGHDEILYTCPNSRSASRQVLGVTRDESMGVGMGMLVGGKRFSHAMKAVRAARRRFVKTHLVIYGEGKRREKLEEFINKNRMNSYVSLPGFTDSVDEVYARSSYLLVTSNREGFGLVIVEAMSQGCIPIAYDIKYGPSDIITDGVDGFLVEPGNAQAMGKAIAKFLRLPAAQKEKMRDAARRRAADFNDEVIVDRWREIVTSCVAVKTAAKSLAK